MHFTGMLAFHLPIVVLYDLRLTAASVLPAVLASAWALYVAGTRHRTGRQLFLAAVLMGLGICAMHYMGMAAMTFSPSARYSPMWVAASIAVAVAVSFVALTVLTRFSWDREEPRFNVQIGTMRNCADRSTHAARISPHEQGRGHRRRLPAWLSSLSIEVDVIGSTVQLVFQGFEEYLESMQATGRMLLTTPNLKPWRIRTVDLGEGVLTWGADGAGTLYHSACAKDRYVFLVSLSPAGVDHLNGKEFTCTSSAWFAPGKDVNFHSFAPARWLALHVHRNTVDERACFWGHDLRLHGNHVLPAVPLVDEYLSLARHCFSIDAVRASLFGPMQRRLLLQEMIDLILAHLSMNASADRRRGRPAAREATVCKAMSLIESNPETGISVQELGSKVGVSAHTLRAAFIEQLGMNPQEYVMLRRLHWIHATLRRAKPGATVSSICARFGVWDFGRFATKYRNHFGELPSQVLSRSFA